MKRATLIAARKALDLTRWEVAMALGIPQRAYAQIEANQGIPSWAVAPRMEMLLGVSADDLLPKADSVGGQAW